MVDLAEGIVARGPLAGVQDAAVKAISENATVTFTKYLQVVLPLDGYIFWVKADLFDPSALLNASPLNSFWANRLGRASEAARTFDATGSLHYLSTQYQVEDESFSLNRVAFTSQVPINDLDSASSEEMYIGEFDGLRFAFAQQGMFYRQAQQWHYEGDAVYPAMTTQVVDDWRQLNTRDVIVSNSLPIWLQLNRFFPMYPSFAVPDNLRPPYAVVHIPPESTSAIQAAPLLGRDLSHYQLVQDRVRVTLYGTRNFNALDFIDYVNQYSLDSDLIGVMNMPTVRDEKRTQNELNTLAMKKTMEFQVSYYQSRIRNVARQLILHCHPSYHFAP